MKKLRRKMKVSQKVAAGKRVDFFSGAAWGEALQRARRAVEREGEKGEESEEKERERGREGRQSSLKYANTHSERGMERGV